MKKIAQNLTALLMVSILAVIANALVNDGRIVLKNGKAKEEVTLNPSRTYKFLINSKQFKKLSVELETKGNIKVVIKAPGGKTLSSGTSKRFTIQNEKKTQSGDFQVILKNIGKSPASIGLKFGDIEGEST